MTNSTYVIYTVIAALIFGIYLIISMYGEVGISFYNGLRIFSDKWNPASIYIWLVNMEINYYLVIFVLFFPCFVYFCCFFVFKHRKFSIDNCCWVIPVTSCFMAVVATVIGIAICFFSFQRDNNIYCRLRSYFRPTNTQLEYFYELFICFLCYLCEIICFWFCFYFVILCKKVKGWMYWVGYEKKKER